MKNFTYYSLLLLFIGSYHSYGQVPACAPVTELNENFDTAVTPGFPDCWTSITRGFTLSEFASIKTSASTIHSAPNSVAFINENSDTAENGGDDLILVSPKLSNLSLGTHRLKFFAKGLDGAIQVGTLSSNSADAIFSPFEVVNTTAGSAEYTVYLTTDTPDAIYIGLRLSTPNMYVTVYVDDIRWEAIPSCPDVSVVVVPAVTTNSATVSWTEGGEENSWEVIYGDATVTDPYTLTTAPIPVTESPTAQITGLTENTHYKAWVRSTCGNGTGAWIGPATFTTECVATANFNESFEDASVPGLPSCWQSILRGTGITENAFIRTVNSDAYLGDKAIQLATANSEGSYDVILVSPNVSTLAPGTYRLRFHAKGNSGSIIEIGALDGNTQDAYFTAIETSFELGSTYEEYKVNFPADENNSYIGIRLKNISNTTATLDEIIWEPVPACPDVTAVAVFEATGSTAQISWAAGGSETNWQVVYDLDSAANPDSLTAINVTGSSETELTGLNSGSTYHVWVRAVCGATEGNGSWVGPITVVTACTSVNVPYIQNFESAQVPALPVCTTSINLGDDPSTTWRITNAPNVNFTSKTLTYRYSSDSNADSWYFTAGINLSAGTSYSITYRYGNDHNTYSERLRVKYGTTADLAGMTLPLANHPDITGIANITNTVTFSPTETGVYYFGFNVYSEYDNSRLYVDDIVIDTQLSNGDFDDNTFTYYPNPVKNLLNLTYKENISNVAVFNMLGQKVIENTVNANTATVDMSALTAGNYIAKVTAANQTKVIKVIKQ